MPFQARNAVFKKLESIVDIASLSKEDRIKYDESIKVYRDNLVTMEYAIQKGIEKGRTVGREEGRAEGHIEIARKMKQSHLPIDMIAEMTGLTKEEIEKL